MKPATDFLNRTIRPGDTIVYAWRRGSQMGLRLLNVTQVTDLTITGYKTDGRLITLTALQNVVVVPRPQTVPPLKIT